MRRHDILRWRKTKRHYDQQTYSELMLKEVLLLNRREKKNLVNNERKNKKKKIYMLSKNINKEQRLPRVFQITFNG